MLSLSLQQAATTGRIKVFQPTINGPNVPYIFCRRLPLVARATTLNSRKLKKLVEEYLSFGQLVNLAKSHIRCSPNPVTVKQEIIGFLRIPPKKKGNLVLSGHPFIRL